MSVHIRPATAEECDRIWPAIRADRLMETREELRAFRDAGPWRVRVTARGEASLLERWKSDLDVLSIRGVWSSARHVPDFAHDALSVARVQDFRHVLSPLLPVELLDGYVSAGFVVTQHIVALQGRPDLVLPADPPVGVSIRRGGPDDVAALARLDAACFDEFWRWGEADLARFLRTERLALAETSSGELIGYTLATVSRGQATLTRLGTAPAFRRHGIGAALLAEAAAWSVRAGADTIALCTQAENAASRSLYSAAGLIELEERYALAMADVLRGAHG